MQLQTTLLSRLPLHGDTLILVRLMYDLGNDLLRAVYQVAARGGDLRASNGVLGSIFEQQTDEGAARVDQEANDDEIEDEEDDGAATHGWEFVESKEEVDIRLESGGLARLKFQGDVGEREERKREKPDTRSESHWMQRSVLKVYTINRKHRQKREER